MFSARLHIGSNKIRKTSNMKKNSNNASSQYISGISSGRLEEIHLIVPKDVANRFRQVAKKSKMTTQELFEEMVETHANGLGLN